jgi:hypothetical protein
MAESKFTIVPILFSMCWVIVKGAITARMRAKINRIEINISGEFGEPDILAAISTPIGAMKRDNTLKVSL